MIFDKRYLQFNNLVFDGYDMITQSDETATNKITSTAYTYGHGSYMPLKSRDLFRQEGSVSMTIALWLKKVPCDERVFYARFAETELSRPGRLWAIKNNEIIWTWAVPRSIHQLHNYEANKAEWDVEFALPDGVWYKADKNKTFVLPYNACSVMDCKGYQDFNECDCCPNCHENNLARSMWDRCGCCCTEDLTKDMALCFHLDKLQSFYGCDTPYQLVYNCEAAEKFNSEKAFGQRLCVSDICDDSVISGQIYSNTDIPTNDVTITLVGHMKNPWIKINGNTNIIKGEYHGKLTITPSGDVYYAENECCEPTLLDPSVWSIPSGNDYGWTIYPLLNSVVVYTNVCASEYGANCVYVDHAAITT